MLDIGDVALRGHVGGGRDITMVEDDGFVTTFRGLFEGDRQQAIHLVAFGDVADQMLKIIGAVGELLLEGDFAGGNIKLSQIFDGEFFPYFIRSFCCRGSRGVCAGW